MRKLLLVILIAPVLVFRPIVDGGLVARATAMHALVPGSPRTATAATSVPGEPFQIPQAAVPVAEHQVCSLLNLQTHNGASITGQDEIGSLKVGSSVYWVFGDTGLSVGGFIPNNIATASAADDPADCVQLDHKRSAGVALPLLPRSGAPDEATVWPAGMVNVTPGVVHFFYASITLNPPPFTSRFIGLAKFDAATLTGVRLGPDPVYGSSFWDPAYGIGSARPVLVGNWVYVFLGAPTPFAAQVKLARVAPSSIEDVTAYTYWDADAQAFTPNFGLADPILSQVYAQLPSEVAWNAYLQKWTMVYTMGLEHPVMSVADQPWGPWSAPSVMFHCLDYYTLGGSGYCYSSQEHEEWQSANGETIYVTVSHAYHTDPPTAAEDYRVYLHAIKLGAAVRQYSDATGQRMYIADGSIVPAGLSATEGIAFFAGTSADAALAPIKKWTSSGEVMYAATQPAPSFLDGGTAFYAATSPTVSYTPVTLGMRAVTRVAYEPVFRWDTAGGSVVQHVYSQFPSVAGYTRGPVAFYAPCPDTDIDGASDCIEAAQGTDPRNPDTDSDGHWDLAATSSSGGAATDITHDNCPTVANPDQANSRPNFIDLHVYGKLFDDTTALNSTTLGDVCNPDLDGDALSNDIEAQLGPSGAAHGQCPGATANTDPLKLDTDGDGFTDRAECMLGTDPVDPASHPPASYTTGDTDHDGLPDALEATLGTNPMNPDSDGDRLLDGVEFLRYGSDPLNPKTDGDICSDGREAASFNDDTKVNSADLLVVAKANSRKGEAKYVPDFDVNKDDKINSADLLLVAKLQATC
jgi:hypothetical protein